MGARFGWGDMAVAFAPIRPLIYLRNSESTGYAAAGPPQRKFLLLASALPSVFPLLFRV
jgi:hypothetical protein